MELICIGVSHRSAPLSVRERLALDELRQVEALVHLAADPVEALWVSTCNRVEVYLASPETDEVGEKVRGLLAALGGEETLAHVYERRSEEALNHLFRVASSLDSMVLGEPQILGQVKDAFELARTHGAARGELTRVCAAAFATAKRVRNETAVGRAAMSMASAAVEMAKKLFGRLDDRTVLLVGAGEMAELAGRHLKSSGAQRVWIANRTEERARELAERLGAEVRPFDEVAALLVDADLVVCTTASTHPIFTPENVAPRLKARRHRPLFMVDLAVPRDIDPGVHALPGVYAYDVDDLQRTLAENAQARAAEAAKAEVLVAEEVARYVRVRRAREGVPVLGLLRARAEEIARAELERTLAALAAEGVSDKARKSVEAMGRAIVNKLLHEPTHRLRSLGEDDARLVEAAAELFGLEPGAGRGGKR